MFNNDNTAAYAGGIVIAAIVILFLLNRGFAGISAGIRVG
jgi:hypothetical protein